VSISEYRGFADGRDTPDTGHDGSRFGRPLDGRNAPVPDIIDATTQVYIIFDGAWFESIPSALTLQKYLVAVKIALCSVSAAPLSFSRRGWRQGDCLC
jgi:hypothetical protein